MSGTPLNSPFTFQVHEGSPAAAAGLVPGDRIIAVGAIDKAAVASKARGTTM